MANTPSELYDYMYRNAFSANLTSLEISLPFLGPGVEFTWGELTRADGAQVNSFGFSFIFEASATPTSFISVEKEFYLGVGDNTGFSIQYEGSFVYGAGVAQPFPLDIMARNFWDDSALSDLKPLPWGLVVRT